MPAGGEGGEGKAAAHSGAPWAPRRHPPPLAGRQPACLSVCRLVPEPKLVHVLQGLPAAIMDDKVAQFMAITNASDSTASFYLDSCGGDVEQAVQAFFDAGGAEGPPAGQPAPAAAPAAAPGGSSMLAQAAAARAARAAGGGGSSTGGSAAAPRPSGGRPARGGRPASNVRSLGDMGGDGDDGSEDDDPSNEYYVGGDKRWVGGGVLLARGWC